MKIEKNDIPLAWVATQVFDFSGRLHDGMHSLRMWLNGKADPIRKSVGTIGHYVLVLNVRYSGTCLQNLRALNTPVLTIQFFGRSPSGKRVVYPVIDDEPSIVGRLRSE